jgi:hypothetical protein
VEALAASEQLEILAVLVVEHTITQALLALVLLEMLVVILL